MNYTTTISESSTYGITAARAAYNAALPATVDEAPNPALLASDSAYLDFVLASAVQSWCKQYASVVVPEVPVAEVNGVPQSITKRQGRAQLKLDGLLTATEGYIFSLPSDDTLRMSYEDSSEWQRTNPGVVAMMSMLGKSVAQTDAFFIAASGL